MYKMLPKNLLILTTAINRSILHNRSFTSYKRFLDGIENITWIINIDFIENEYLDKNTEITKKNLLNIFSDKNNVNFEIIENDLGCFNKAVRTVLNKSKEYLNDIDCVLYLEDDWYHNEKKNFKLFPDIANINKDFIINLTDRIKTVDYVITNQPTLWSVNAFKNFIKVFDTVNDYRMDPELILERNYLKVSNLKNLNDFYLNKMKCFEDIGRSWMKQNTNIKKQSKDKTGYNTYKLDCIFNTIKEFKNYFKNDDNKKDFLDYDNYYKKNFSANILDKKKTQIKHNKVYIKIKNIDTEVFLIDNNTVDINGNKLLKDTLYYCLDDINWNTLDNTDLSLDIKISKLSFNKIYWDNNINNITNQVLELKKNYYLKFEKPKKHFNKLLKELVKKKWYRVPFNSLGYTRYNIGKFYKLKTFYNEFIINKRKIKKKNFLYTMNDEYIIIDGQKITLYDNTEYVNLKPNILYIKYPNSEHIEINDNFWSNSKNKEYYKKNISNCIFYFNSKYFNNISEHETSILKENTLYFKENYSTRTLCHKGIQELYSNPDINSIINNNNIINIIKKYLKCDKPVIRISNVFHNIKSDGSPIYQKKHKYHIDVPQLQAEGFKFIKLFIPLSSKITIKNGVTYIVKGSRENLPYLIDKWPTSRYSDKFIENYYDKSQIITIDSEINDKYGNIFLVRTDGFHKGGHIIEGNRTMIIVQYSNF